MTHTTTKDFYELLGVSKESTTEEIRKVYRKLAHQYHPDKTGGDAEAETKLKEINEAYDVLKNKKKRKKYDATREGRFGGFAAGDFEYSQGAGFGDNFADILSTMFGMGPGPDAYAAVRAGRDLSVTLSVTLGEVAEGAAKTLLIARSEICGDCHGSGAARGSEPEPCRDCGGAGQLFRSAGRFQSSRSCPSCHGLGSTIKTPCGHCEGRGRTPVRREIKVTIPKGIDQDTRLRLKGEGEAGDPGAPPGDLHVHIDIEPDPFFAREGKNLLCEVPITFAQAALGAKVRVPTLVGIAEVTVPEGTQNGAKLRMGGMGLPLMGGGPKGDQFVKVLVEIPRKLTKAQRELIGQLDETDEAGSLPLMDRFRRLLDSFRASS